MAKRRSQPSPSNGRSTGVHDQNQLDIHQEQLRSQTFFDYALTSFNREETVRIQKAYADPEHPEKPALSLAEIIRPNLSVSPRRKTTILVVGVTNRNPE